MIAAGTVPGKSGAAQHTEIARAGWESDADQSPHLATSKADAAWRIGRWLRTTGRTAPSEVRPSRGDTWHCNGMLLRLTWTSGACTIERER